MNVKIIPVRVLNAKGLGSSIEINRGIRWAVDQGAQIVNLSLGYEISLSKTNTSMFKNDFFARLAKRGVVVFAAAGNDGFVNGSSTNSGVRYSFPASYDHVIAVAATDKAGKLSDFTVRGDRIDIAAPGTGILATYSEGSYVYSSGTSMASPIAAGSYGLALANIIDRLGPLDRISPNISIDSVESALVTGFTLEKSDVASQGIIDASKLLSILDTKFPLKKVDAPDEGEKNESSSTRGSSGNGGSEVSSDNSGDTTTSDNSLDKVTFAFEGLSEGQVVSGFHNIQLQGVPSGTALIALYWGEKKSPFTTINVQSESEVKTKTRWSFKGIGKLRAYAFSANRNVVAKTEILLQGK
ncbi:MAG: S8 family serine peptidase [Bdellovibrionota bacterium]